MEYYNPAERAAEKEKSRQQDAEDLTSGKKSAEQLRKENSIFLGLKFKINFSK